MQTTTTWLVFALSLMFTAPTIVSGQNLYVADSGNNQVWVIDTGSNAIIGSPIALSNSPEGMAITQDGSQLYVVDTKIEIIDTASSTVTGSVPGLGQPSGIVISPDGSALYAAFNGNVRIISTASNTVTAMINLQAGSTSYLSAGNITVSTDGSTLYTIDQPTGALLAINLATNTVTATGCVAPNTQNHADATALPNGTVYMADNIDSTISVCDPSSGAQTSFATNSNVQWPTYNTGSDMIISPDGQSVFTVGPKSQEINIADSSVTATFSPNLFFQSAIALSPDGGTLYVAAGSQVYAVDVASGKTKATINVGAGSLNTLAIQPGPISGGSSSERTARRRVNQQ